MAMNKLVNGKKVFIDSECYLLRNILIFVINNSLCIKKIQIIKTINNQSYYAFQMMHLCH